MKQEHDGSNNQKGKQATNNERGKQSSKTGRNNGKAGKPGYKPKKQGMQDKVDGAPFPDQDQLPTRKQRGAAEADNIQSRTNDPKSYKKFDQFAIDSATLPFALPTGAPLNIVDHAYAGTDSGSQVAPGVMALYFIPSIGVSSNFNSPINRSSIRFYTYMRSNQKASATYDHQDVTMMEIAMDSAFLFHGLCSKLYAIINQFTPANEYLSRTTIEACGGDFNDLRANLQDFRAYINAYAYSLGQFALPKDMELFNRHRWMVEGQYTDSDSKKAQIYMFVPAGFWQYDNTVTTGSQCKWISYQGITGTQTFTFAQLKALGDGLLNAISGDEDFAIISGDIYNFYGGDTYKLPYIDEGYTVSPAYDKRVLSQIENAVVMPIDVTSLVITQNPSVNQGAIIFQPTLTETSYSVSTQLNFHWDSPSPDDVLDATRLVSVASSTSNTIATCGTEIISGLRVFSRNNQGQTVSVQYQSNQIQWNADAASAAEINTLKQLMQLAQFDWAPQVRVWYHPSTGTANTFCGTTWDLDNFNMIPEGYIANIHLASLLSLFTVVPNREN